MEENCEYQIFALIFKQPGSITYFAEHLKPEVVGLPTGSTGIHEFYQNLLEFYRHTGLDPIDPIAFREWLRESDISAAMGGDAMVSTYIATITSLAELGTPEGLTAVLNYRANKRKQIDYVQELQKVLNSKDYKTEEDRDRIAQLTELIRTIEQEIGYDPLATVLTASDIALKADNIWDLPDFIKTPYNDLNICLGYTTEGGFCKGAVHALIAQSGHGKSTFAKCLTNYWLDQGLSVLFVNYEEAQAHWDRILMTQITGKNVYEGATVAEKQYYTQIFKDRLTSWGKRLMVRHDPDTPYFDDLEKWLRDIIGHGENIPDVVVIDTIQSMFMKGSGGRPRWGQFEEMMVRLEKLAKEMHAVFIITSQENSNRMKEKREVVQQSDAGGSLTIIQKSAVTIFITRKNISGQDDEVEDTIMELQIPKNRITGGKYMKQPPLVRYDDTTKSYEPFELLDEAPYRGDHDLDLEDLRI